MDTTAPALNAGRAARESIVMGWESECGCGETRCKAATDLQLRFLCTRRSITASRSRLHGFTPSRSSDVTFGRMNSREWTLISMRPRWEFVGIPSQSTSMFSCSHARKGCKSLQCGQCGQCHSQRSLPYGYYAHSLFFPKTLPVAPTEHPSPFLFLNALLRRHLHFHLHLHIPLPFCSRGFV